MKTKVKATTSFMHGRLHAHAGDEIELTKGDADELIKAGLVQEVPSAQAPQPPEAAAQESGDDVTDILGEGEKMDDEPRNKMEAAPDNKAGGKKTSVKKADQE